MNTINLTYGEFGAILDGIKTQLRRPLEPQPKKADYVENEPLYYQREWTCPYGNVGDLIHGVCGASRLALKIVESRIERLQELDKHDAFDQHIISSDVWAEGCRCPNPVAKFAMLWDIVYGNKYPWASNPWVWVLVFERVGEQRRG